MKIKILCRRSFFLPGRAKDLSAPLYSTLRPERVRGNTAPCPYLPGDILHGFFSGKYPPLGGRSIQLTAYFDLLHKKRMHGTSPYLFQLWYFFKRRATSTNNATESDILFKKTNAYTENFRYSLTYAFSSIKIVHKICYLITRLHLTNHQKSVKTRDRDWLVYLCF